LVQKNIIAPAATVSPPALLPLCGRFGWRAVNGSYLTDGGPSCRTGIEHLRRNRRCSFASRDSGSFGPENCRTLQNQSQGETISVSKIPQNCAILVE